MRRVGIDHAEEKKKRNVLAFPIALESKIWNFLAFPFLLFNKKLCPHSFFPPSLQFHQKLYYSCTYKPNQWLVNLLSIQHASPHLINNTA